jgi:hypothetical protein
MISGLARWTAVNAATGAETAIMTRCAGRETWTPGMIDHHLGALDRATEGCPRPIGDQATRSAGRQAGVVPAEPGYCGVDASHDRMHYMIADLEHTTARDTAPHAQTVIMARATR